MADSGDEDLSSDLDGGGSAKKGGGKGFLTGVLKYILIGIAAIILIVTIVVVVNLIMNKNNTKATSIPVSDEYVTTREVYDWYTSLDQVRTNTRDPIPASVVVQVAIGYKKDDKNASAEITSRRIEISAFLRRFFSQKTVAELGPENEDVLRQQIRDQINDDILSSSKIRDIQFTSLDVVQQ